MEPSGHGDGSDAERLVPPPRDFASRPLAARSHPGVRSPGDRRRHPRHGDARLGRIAVAPRARRVGRLRPVASPPDPGGRKEGGAEPLPSTLVALLGRAGFGAEASPRPAPPLALRDLDGNATSLAEHRDRPVLVLFWGTTCSHCLAELPAAVRFAERHRNQGRGLDVLPVCVDETDAAVVRAVAGPAATRQPLYVDPSATARLYYDVQALPSFVLIDRSGRLIARASGARDWTDPALDELIHECLALSAPADPPRPTPGQEDGNATRPDHRPG